MRPVLRGIAPVLLGFAGIVGLPGCAPEPEIRSYTVEAPTAPTSA